MFQASKFEKKNPISPLKIFLTDGELEHILQSLKKLRIAFINTQINLPQIRSTIHTDFHINPSAVHCRRRGLCFLHLKCIFPKRSNRWPPHNLSPTKPTSQNTNWVTKKNTNTKDFLKESNRHLLWGRCRVILEIPLVIRFDCRWSGGWIISFRNDSGKSKTKLGGFKIEIVVKRNIGHHSALAFGWRRRRREKGFLFCLEMGELFYR